MKYSRLIIHSLALTGPISNIEEVITTARTANHLGAAGVEYLLGNYNIPPEGLAKAYLNTGCTKMTLCHANLDASKGNPLNGGDEMRGRIEEITGVIEYASQLRDAGVDINTIDGPLLVLLGEQKNPSDAFERAIEFGDKLATIAQKHSIRLAVERLQPSEDGVIRSAEKLMHIVRSINSSLLGTHEDTFHALKNAGDCLDPLRRYGGKLFHFHANGIGVSKETDGRIPCGCRGFEVESESAETRLVDDIINWRAVATAFHEHAPADCLIGLEPFSEKACGVIPPLRTGVVPIKGIGELRMSIENLAAAGLLVAE